jgi:hypothetical protein
MTPTKPVVLLAASGLALTLAGCKGYASGQDRHGAGKGDKHGR